MQMPHCSSRRRRTRSGPSKRPAIEAAGFQGIYCASFAMAWALPLHGPRHEDIKFGTSIMPFTTCDRRDLAQSRPTSTNQRRPLLHGIGVSHEPALSRLGVNAGKPLTDTQSTSNRCARLPSRTGRSAHIPRHTAHKDGRTLDGDRRRGRLGERLASHMGESFAHPAESATETSSWRMIPTCSDDKRPRAAMNVNSAPSLATSMLPNYRTMEGKRATGKRWRAKRASNAKTATPPGLMTDALARRFDPLRTRKQVLEGSRSGSPGVKRRSLPSSRRRPGERPSRNSPPFA